jgi:hypothetical protein
MGDRAKDRFATNSLMPILLHGVTYWRNRAEEARAVAEQLTTPAARRVMLDIAEGYDKLAEGAEERIVASTRNGDDRS